MANSKFRRNLQKLLEISEDQELCDFLIEKEAFEQNFVRLITDSDCLNEIDSDSLYYYNVEDVKDEINYELTYNKKNKKIVVDITKNNTFSYYDSEEDLIKKMKKFIRTEEYEKANMLNNYLEKLEITYQY